MYKIVIILFMLSISGHVHADFTASTNGTITPTNLGAYISPSYPTELEACNDLANYIRTWAANTNPSVNSATITSVTPQFDGSESCDIRILSSWNPSNDLSQVLFTETGAVCEIPYVDPDFGATCFYLINPTPQLTATFTEETTDCEAKEGEVFATGFFEIGTLSTGTLSPILGCDGSCRVIYNGTGTATHNAIVNGVTTYYALGSYFYLTPGEECTATNTATALNELPTETCAPGQTAGNVNGMFTCFTDSGDIADTDAPEPPIITDTTTVDNGDGTTTTTIVETNQGTGGTTTTTTTTNTTTGESTSVTVNENGGSENNEGDSQETTDFCTQNPTASICLVSTNSGGTSCNVLPVCDGDAIQCAIDYKLWQLNCTDEQENAEPSQSEIQSKLESILGTENRTGADLEEDAVSVEDMIDTTSVYSSTCLPPHVMVIYGQTLTFNFDEWCELLRIAGFLIVLIGGLVSARIVIT